MPAFNDDSALSVNDHSVYFMAQHPVMSKKPEIEPSPFWVRLAECLKEQDKSTSQNGVAKLLGKKGNGTTGPWYRGESIPPMAVVVELATIGKVTTDWLYTGRQPKYPLDNDKDLGKLIALWNSLDTVNRKNVLLTAENAAAAHSSGLFRTGDYTTGRAIHDGDPAYSRRRVR